MANKTVKKEIVLEQDNGRNGGISVVGTLQRRERLMDTSTMPLSRKLGAIILGGLLIDTLKESYDSLVRELADTPEADILAELGREGLISEGETPVITVVDRSGKKHSGIIGTTTANKFNMEAFKDFAKNPSSFKALPKDFKEEKIKGAAYFRKLYTEGKLGSYGGMFSMEPERTTKIKGVKVVADPEPERKE